MLRKRILLFVLLIFCALGLDAQKRTKKVIVDSVHVKGRTFLVVGDTTIFVPKDTVIYLPDSLAIKIRKDREAQSSQFYLKIKEKLSKRRLTKELYDLLFKDPPKPKTPVSTNQAVTNDYEKYTGQVIGQIFIKKLEPLGTSINDTSRHSNKWILKSVNNTHINTRSRIIRNNMFFKSGDVLDPNLIYSSERILRSLSFIKDARIYVIPNRHTRLVDVLVVTRDIWSISGGFGYDDFDDFEVEITDKNFLGLGQELKNEFPYSAETSPEVGYIGTYTINNIKSSFINSELTFARSEPFDRRGIRFYKDFITPTIKWAGGLEIAQEKRQQAKVYPDSTYIFNTRYNFQDFWTGRSYLLKQDYSGYTNFQVAGRYERRRFLDRPVISSDTNQLYFDTNLKLMSIGITKRRFERSSLIVGYGRTEDIPIGYLAEITGGRENNDFYDRTYLGTTISYGNYLGKLGYLRPTLSIGGFIEKRNIQQGVIKPELSYFSYLYRFRRTSFRQFFTLGYVKGINRYTDEFIDINNRNGIRGLRDTFLRGTKKITFRSETVAFTPIYFIGFRLAIFAFFDFAIVNSEQAKLFKNPLYQGYGIGFRFRNENLAFNTLQIRLGYYPNAPADFNNYQSAFDGQRSLNIPDFRVEEPRVITFQ
ncbi:hypothetical protein [Fulvivirga lutimaris]|uniref:hypothetical protein n=1 Tax=Fulvivirga lutimaris TaxID=1819566 RepID=UPI0012BD30D7|nr:hypothetical protein [Fulvivirga lutimaris]MTI38170.1 hypothetical protein [Fulvivirga lutimaris]